jgi:hypothetical protein
MTKSLRLWSTKAGIRPLGLSFVYSTIQQDKIVGAYPGFCALLSHRNPERWIHIPSLALQEHGRLSIRLDRCHGYRV